MRVLQHDAGGGRETTVSFGVALELVGAISLFTTNQGGEATSFSAAGHVQKAAYQHLKWVLYI